MSNEIAPSPLSRAEQKEFQKQKQVIQKWCDDRFAVGAALRQIRDDRLYRADYKSFDDFCRAEFKWTRDNADKLISAAKVVAALPAGSAKRIQNPSQARALAEIPEHQRTEVIDVIATNGEMTADKITEAGQQIEAGEERKDVTGILIPEEILAEWDRMTAYKEVLDQLSGIKRVLVKSVEDDIAFSEISNTTAASLGCVISELQRVLPHAVCPTCQGLERMRCKLCKGRGYISKFLYNNTTSQKAKEIRKQAA